LQHRAVSSPALNFPFCPSELLRCGDVESNPGPNQKPSRRRRPTRRAPAQSSNQNLAYPLARVNLPLRNSFQTKLRYSSEVSLDAAIGTPATWQFRANDLYDPDYSGVGHQPYGTDQLFAMYDHAVVTAARITVHCANTYTYPIWLALKVSDSVSYSSTVDKLLEQPFVRAQLKLNQSGSVSTPLNHSVDVAKFLGISRQGLLSGPDYRCSASNSPAEVVYFQLYVEGQGSDNPTAVIAHVLIEFDAVFVEPKTLVDS